MTEDLIPNNDLKAGEVAVPLYTGRVAVIRELNALEETQVNEMVDVEKLMGLSNYQAVASIVSLGDEKFRPAANAGLLRARLQKLTGRELRQIQRAKEKAFGLPEDEEDVKKQSTDDEA